MNKLLYFFRKIVPSAFLVASIVTGIYVFTRLEFKEDCFLKMEINPSVGARVKFYFDTGHGFIEKQIVRKAIRATGKFQVVRFALPEKEIDMIRLDPFQKPGRFLIRKLKVVDRLDNEIYDIPMESFRLAHHMEIFEKENGHWVGVTTPDAFDPQLIIEDTRRLRKAIKDHFRLNVIHVLKANSHVFVQLFGAVWLIGMAAFELRCWFLQE